MQMSTRIARCAGEIIRLIHHIILFSNLISVEIIRRTLSAYVDFATTGLTILKNHI